MDVSSLKFYPTIPLPLHSPTKSRELSVNLCFTLPKKEKSLPNILTNEIIDVRTNEKKTQKKMN